MYFFKRVIVVTILKFNIIFFIKVSISLEKRNFVNRMLLRYQNIVNFSLFSNTDLWNIYAVKGFKKFLELKKYVKTFLIIFNWVLTCILNKKKLMKVLSA